MAKAKKLPSGSWRCLVYDYTDSNGKRRYKSFTSDDPSSAGKRAAEYAAAEYAATKEYKTKTDMTFGEALDKYIESRSSVLAESTIREYTRVRKNQIGDLENIKLTKIDQQLIQDVINKYSQKLSPKSVRNLHGLISAVLKAYVPELKLNTSLPQKIKPNLYIPTDADIEHLFKFVKDDDMMIAILLAAFGPMRRSEIAELKSSDITNGIIHVRRAIVMNKENQWVVKSTKSTAGDRFISLPSFVYDKIKDIDGKIVKLNPSQISDRFIDIQKASELKHFRFHDLRHYCASIQHAIGIPDAYIMQRGGWGSDAVLKQVYRHALSDKTMQMDAVANEHFESLCNTKCNTKK